MTNTFDRRWLLRSAGAACLAAAGAPAVRAAEPIDPARLTELMAELGGRPVPSAAVVLEVPAIADDGAIVPVGISSALADTRELFIFVDVNPQKLALRFSVAEGTEPYLATRIRMAGSGTVVAAARTADGQLHVASRSVKVTVGGCG